MAPASKGSTGWNGLCCCASCKHGTIETGFRSFAPIFLFGFVILFMSTFFKFYLSKFRSVEFNFRFVRRTPSTPPSSQHRHTAAGANQNRRPRAQADALPYKCSHILVFTPTFISIHITPQIWSTKYNLVRVIYAMSSEAAPPVALWLWSRLEAGVEHAHLNAYRRI